MMRIPTWLFFLGIVGLFFATIICAGLAYITTRDAAVALGDSGVDTDLVSFDVFAQGQPTSTATPTLSPTLTPTNTPQPGETIIPEPTNAPELPTETPDPLGDIPRLEDQGRKTILLMGIDERSAVDTEQAYRSDTMILVNVNPAAGTVGMVSIPRDIYVAIPGVNQNYRINTANYLGDLNDYPGGGGPALAAETIRQNFGIQVDNYVRVNFDVFTAVVDTLAPNGIEVCPSQAIYDPKYPDAGYGTIEVRFEAGCQRLNAERLLQYARTRATEGGDFDRARRQQEVLKAAQAELLSVGGIANFITQIPSLYQQLSDNIKTDLTLDEIIALGAFASSIENEDITSAVIDNRHILGFATTPEGDQVTLPDLAAIRRLVQETFTPPPDLTIAELRERAQQENASIVVFNDTTTAGLASRTGEWLASREVIVGTPGNMPEPSEGLTYIRDYTNNVWTTRYLAALLDIPNDRILPGNDGLTSSDVMIVAGSDMESKIGGAPVETEADGG